MLVVKPGNSWEEETEDGGFSIIPLTSKEQAMVTMSIEEESVVKELEKYQVFNIPDSAKSIRVSNSSEEFKSYIILKKGEVSE